MQDIPWRPQSMSAGRPPVALSPVISRRGQKLTNGGRFHSSSYHKRDFSLDRMTCRMCSVSSFWTISREKAVWLFSLGAAAAPREGDDRENTCDVPRCSMYSAHICTYVCMGRRPPMDCRVAETAVPPPKQTDLALEKKKKKVRKRKSYCGSKDCMEKETKTTGTERKAWKGAPSAF